MTISGFRVLEICRKLFSQSILNTTLVPQDLLLPGDTMSVRDPLIEGDGEFHSYVEDTEIETGYSVAHLDLFLSRVSIC